MDTLPRRSLALANAKKATILAAASGSKKATTLVVASRDLLLILSLAIQPGINGRILWHCVAASPGSGTDGDARRSGHTIGQPVNAEKS